MSPPSTVCARLVRKGQGSGWGSAQSHWKVLHKHPLFWRQPSQPSTNIATSKSMPRSISRFFPLSHNSLLWEGMLTLTASSFPSSVWPVRTQLLYYCYYYLHLPLELIPNPSVFVVIPTLCKTRPRRVNADFYFCHSLWPWTLASLS